MAGVVLGFMASGSGCDRDPGDITGPEPPSRGYVCTDAGDCSCSGAGDCLFLATFKTCDKCTCTDAGCLCDGCKDKKSESKPGAN